MSPTNRDITFTRPFVIIEDFSVISDEREVLISMGSVFCLQTIEFNVTFQMWTIQMVLIEYNKNDVKQLKIDPLTHEVSLETYQDRPNNIDPNDEYPLFTAALSDTISVQNYVKLEKNKHEIIQQQTDELKKE
jgi:hypothetical protein